jgi:hypothetical protein
MPRPKMIGPTKPCSVGDCYKEAKARGYCHTHWALWKRNGKPEKQNRPILNECSAEGCTVPPRSSHAEYCETHYYRLRRSGCLDEPRKITGTCLAKGCDKPANHAGAGAYTSTEGYCRLHYLRLKKRGDTSFECHLDNHPRWTGDDATNKAVHQRLRSMRGQARSWSCTDCSCPALHWSYDHGDPNELDDSRYGPYSLDPERYQPRCARCHKLFDLAHSRTRAA